MRGGPSEPFYRRRFQTTSRCCSQKLWLPFKRYADDIIVHCRTERQANLVRVKIAARLTQCGLELHPEKTKVVYCKDANRQETHPNEKWTEPMKRSALVNTIAFRSAPSEDRSPMPARCSEGPFPSIRSTPDRSGRECPSFRRCASGGFLPYRGGCPSAQLCPCSSSPARPSPGPAARAGSGSFACAWAGARNRAAVIAPTTSGLPRPTEYSPTSIPVPPFCELPPERPIA